MKKLERRAIICLMMAAILLIGLGVFTFRFVKHGGEWATFYGNQAIYSNGHLNRGAVYDINGELLVKNTKDSVEYNPDPDIRRATVHAVGNERGDIQTSALSIFKDKIIGYNLLTGTYSFSEKSNEIKLTLDADVCRTALDALDGRNGTVGVYNYKTGEVICMVSTPTFDPTSPPNVAEAEPGTFINKFISATYTPGSIFKLITAAAAIENLDDLENFSYNCTGVRMVNGEAIRCSGIHGYVNFYSALSKSCNGVFSILSERVGASTMQEYVDRLGLTSSYDLNGVKTKKGKFEFPDTRFNLGWAGIGQYKDQINPCSMMVYMGAIANGGRAANPYMIHSLLPKSGMTRKMIETETAEELQEMMKYNVKTAYGFENFPDLDIYAKSGTAENASGLPNAMFSGFIKNEGCPYAFIVCVENGGYGYQVAAPIANEVLQEVVSKRG